MSLKCDIDPKGYSLADVTYTCKIYFSVRKQTSTGACGVKQSVINASIIVNKGSQLKPQIQILKQNIEKLFT
ncbi:unnamed protein product [Rotaria sp. Silwood2]|nr:unnamed protein product [Rotaria sp. Silwood2]CAF4387477.1 unnamed protein product [Rotaria sp. Silwood2]